MPGYLTRNMEALRELTHGDRLVQAGEQFACAEIDADYYIRHRSARDAAADEGRQPQAPTPDNQPQRRRRIAEAARDADPLPIPSAADGLADATAQSESEGD